MEEYEFVPERIAREIEQSGATSTFIASDGSGWLQCDQCERWISGREAKIREALPCEQGYDDNGFAVVGGGQVIVCPECYKVTCPCEHRGTWVCLLEEVE